MKKEIKVWVTDNIISRNGYIPNVIERFCDSIPQKLNGKDTIKATLIIDLPERKIEISESDFDKAVAGLIYQTRSASDASGLIRTVKQKLFDKSED